MTRVSFHDVTNPMMMPEKSWAVNLTASVNLSPMPVCIVELVSVKLASDSETFVTSYQAMSWLSSAETYRRRTIETSRAAMTTGITASITASQRRKVSEPCDCSAHLNH